ncbi:hypothetical protein X925_04515 [Petrotoga sp. 9T1HF07.CasAA.8.2]|uniref:SufD family Fe-S cluster assembly protein n=1 Tax=Petrotoga sp. 9T1HF07.CasAA.8.2 TaxID=1434329 RepID=UPI000CB29DAE|nr:SufD family Fe-S cluster assembly protein [Petrotoga sp. 9T1HF07.CasAA.8.2]PNR88966.1 hypothetical protein X925_04515 [Petrotoga sp. 9T1HF07.CasAA.8.2]
METIFEKPIDMRHKNLKAVEWQIPQITPKRDYGDYEFQASLEHISNELLKTFKNYRYEAYKNWGFPKWKRTKLNGYEPDKYFSFVPVSSKGKILGLNGIDQDGIEILAKYDFEGAHRKFLLMAEAFSNTGFYLKTNEGEEREPIILTYDWKFPIYETSVYNISPFSKATVIRYLMPSKNEKLFRTTSNRIVVKENASLELININLCNDDSLNIDNTLIEVQKNGNVEVVDINIGGRITSPHIVFRLAGEGAQAHLYPYFLGDKDNVIDMLYLMRFYSPETTGAIDAKGVIKDESKAIFRGFLDLKKGAKEANASESEYTLTLSEKAKAEAFPSLLVDENEVNAAHAATVGTIEKEKLYYLMTRGFSLEEAKKLISSGLFESAIDRIKVFDEGMSQVVKDVIFQRI